MIKKITKAVIPAAGLGTRMLPISRTVPKEMLPIVDRPSISYIVDEAIAAGITDILIITVRGKESIENYFDYTHEYEEKLKSSGRAGEIEDLRSVCSGANIYFLRQHETKGLGHAVGCAKNFTGSDPFMVLYGDDVIISNTPVCTQLISAYEKYGLPSAGVQEVPLELIYKYCTLKTVPLEDKIFKIETMIEKPRRDQVMKPYFSILGRVLLTSDVYGILDDLKPGANGEIQLTDAMSELCGSVGMTAVDFEGKRYDMGSKLGYLKANVEQAALNPELGEEFIKFLKEFVKGR